MLPHALFMIICDNRCEHCLYRSVSRPCWFWSSNKHLAHPPYVGSAYLSPGREWVLSRPWRGHSDSMSCAFPRLWGLLVSSFTYQNILIFISEHHGPLLCIYFPASLWYNHLNKLRSQIIYYHIMCYIIM